MTPYEHASFPPRGKLPTGITITRLPGLGTTWYERGIAYWCRRTGNVLLLCIGLAVYTGVFVGAALAVGPSGSPGFLAVLIAEIVFSLGTSVLAFRHLWRISIGRPAVPAGRQTTTAGVGAVLSAFWLGSVGAFILGVAVLLTGGFLLAAVAIWLVPVPPTEQRARQLLADELVYYHHRGHAPGLRRGDRR